MQFRYVATGLMVAVSLAGCQRTSYSPYDNLPSQPAPLQAQPVPQVQSNQLPPPGGATQFPTAPMQETASLDPNASAPTTALDVTKEQMVGNWRVSNAGSSCDMFLTLTNLGSGSRGGTRGCAGELTAMGSWEVSGKMVQFKDRAGNVIGRVYKSADNRFDGTTNSGQPVSLSR
ncbi:MULTISPECIES: protease inhibitor Inh/omp19 family protein [Pseudorhizobium]|uniref:Outer membrane lipoprotein omp19 n=1 Tax=Pseudorhizobium pelagicum TaxID=1509405 RepID=A0A922P0F2_9HYPH|nr:MULTISPECIES: protease inhibitor Inh/omp19 family protein [Pseudorhizobium]MBA4784808.1 protease inhibitor Inh/omp19 family protein [Hyphomicrobiales bacterium]MBU1316172.1 protease inhibitor Inh/omp19 family protein [Alphaproteobacteria bacterium]MDY6961402.1 protease inhibitor Inh/omp19 family protein [Pseudomonadota bacterium]KEQ07112.1 membrane protein [Pseudorhizobium pelagicum]KEQ10057.1 membrane protein [Pseudorhizobium pelagicum]